MGACKVTRCKVTSKMKVKSSGRDGYRAAEPVTKAVKVLAQIFKCAKSPPVGKQLQAFCSALSKAAAWPTFSGFDDDEVRGLTVELLLDLGVTRVHAARVLAKARGLLMAQEE